MEDIAQVLKDLTITVAARANVSPDAVRVSYESVEGDWGWEVSISYYTRNRNGAGSRKPFKFQARAWTPLLTQSVEEALESLARDKQRVL